MLKKNILITVLISLGVVILVAIIGFIIYGPRSEEEITKPTDWKTYKNEEHGFEIKYPTDWEVDESYRGVSFSSKDYSWKPRFGYGTNFGIGVNAYTEIGAWGGCIIKGEEKIIAKDIKLYPLIYTYLEEKKFPTTEEECSQLPLWDSHLIDTEFCVDKNKQYLGKYCQEGSGNFYYQIGLSCGGEEWKERGGMDKCLRLFNQMVSTFRFIEE